MAKVSHGLWWRSIDKAAQPAGVPGPRPTSIPPPPPTRHKESSSWSQGFCMCCSSHQTLFPQVSPWLRPTRLSPQMSHPQRTLTNVTKIMCPCACAHTHTHTHTLTHCLAPTLPRFTFFIALTTISCVGIQIFSCFFSDSPART